MIKRCLITIGLLAIIAPFTGYSGASPPAPACLGRPKTAMVIEPSIWMTASDVETECNGHLTAAREIRDELVASKGLLPLENTLLLINKIYIEIDRAMGPARLMANVHSEKAVRTAAEKCRQAAEKFKIAIALDRDIYDALLVKKTDGLDPMATRFLNQLLREYRRSGVNQDKATRKELARLRGEIIKTGQQYTRAIREDKRFIDVSSEQLTGVPDDFLATHPPDENGKIRITTTYPDFIPVINYSDAEEVRKHLYLAFMKRAYPENTQVIKKLLQLRYDYAVILGYSDWADYNAEDKMVKNTKTVSDFIDKVAGISRNRMERELKALLLRKIRDNKNAKNVRVWDRYYYLNKIKAEKYYVDAKKVREYLEYSNVKDGILMLTQELFGVTFMRVPDAPVWHEDVEAYNLLEGGDVLGRFYLDMHPRDGKFGHAANFQVRLGIEGVQVPVASLVCNFPKPSSKGPVLMEHDEVVVFFHEFGHLLHHLFAGGQDWITMSGIACERDFSEVPSQLLEEWTCDYNVLKRFAVHYKTGKPIPEDLVTRMRKAHEYGKGLFTMRQMFYAGLSLEYHNKNPETIDLLQTVKELQEKYDPYPYEKGTYLFANFDHLQAYSSMYYTYMWSLMLAKDMFTKFSSSTNLMDRENATAYRKYVLAPGGSVDASQMVKNFLGRDYSFDALGQWLEKE